MDYYPRPSLNSKQNSYKWEIQCNAVHFVERFNFTCEEQNCCEYRLYMQCLKYCFPIHSWKKGTCKLNKACTYAHGDDELNAWNEHLEKMNQGNKGESETKITKPKNDERATISLPKEKPVKRPAPNYKVRCYQLIKFWSALYHLWM